LEAIESGAVPRPRRVLELFAGVGGFRVGLERSGWNIVWSNLTCPPKTVPVIMLGKRRQ